MDGTQRNIIIGKVGRANGLTIDYVRRRLYWTELGQHVIESSDLDGKQRAIVVSENIEKPFGLTQYLVRLSIYVYYRAVMSLLKLLITNLNEMYSYVSSVTFR
jgi:low density lipoprotein receptor-related protein 5/6